MGDDSEDAADHCRELFLVGLVNKCDHLEEGDDGRLDDLLICRSYITWQAK